MSRQRTRSLVTIAVILALTAALGSATWPVHSQGAPEGTADAALIESIRRVSVATDGTQANGDSLYPAVSADGHYLVFTSNASNLVSGDTNNKGDVFVRNLMTGNTTRISIASDGSQANGTSYVFFLLQSQPMGAT